MAGFSRSRRPPSGFLLRLLPKRFPDMPSPRVKRALISVSDKLGLAGFARGLVEAGVEIYSTGGTRAHLESEEIPVTDVSAYTGFPEMMDGRLKTLHPMVHGGILCRHDNPSDMDALDEHGIKTFELVVVNLYPFEQTVAREGVTEDEAIEKIDIGGPTMVRAAAKNHAFTTIATNSGPIFGDSRRNHRERLARPSSCGRNWQVKPSITRPSTIRRSRPISPACGPKVPSPAICRSDSLSSGRPPLWREPPSTGRTLCKGQVPGGKPCVGYPAQRQGTVLQQPA